MIFHVTKNSYEMSALSSLYKKKFRVSSAATLNGTLTFTTLLTNSTDDKLLIFSYFSKKTGFNISCQFV